VSHIHDTAIVDPGAGIGKDVEIGPFCVIGPDVTIGPGTRLASHVVVQGRTAIGRDNRIESFTVLGGPPQHLRHLDGGGALVIGDRNTIREHVTINTAIDMAGEGTRVGSDCFLMEGVHIAHDCVVGDRVIMSAKATIGGHVVLEEQCVLGGLGAVHQFCRVGRHAMVGALTCITRDLPPYCICFGTPAYLLGLNIVGLKRRGFPQAQLRALRSAYHGIFLGNGEFRHRVEAVAADHDGDEAVSEMVGFILASRRGVLQPE
jgi:UDP-N-acetylglucosamine acyltransferase